MLKSIASRLRHLRIVVFHRLLPGTALRRAMGRTKEHELELCLLPALSDPTKAAIDVGANAGVYTAALMPLASHVIAIEPHPRLARIVGSLPADRVTVCRALASSSSGRMEHLDVEVHAQKEADALGRIASGPRQPNVRRFAAATIALDDFADRAIGFVKIDVEGHELDVLEGAGRLIEAQRPVFLVEAEARHRVGAPEDIFAFFDRHDYAGFFARDGSLHPTGEFDPSLQDESGLANYATRKAADYVNNFIFVPRENDQVAITAACGVLLAQSA